MRQENSPRIFVPERFLFFRAAGCDGAAANVEDENFLFLSGVDRAANCLRGDRKFK